MEIYTSNHFYEQYLVILTRLELQSRFGDKPLGIYLSGLSPNRDCSTKGVNYAPP